MNIPQIRMNLDGPNELQFKFSIKGSMTEGGNAVEPRVRFFITEAETGMIIGYPMGHKPGGVVEVQIPRSLHLFKEGTEYLGNVEVLVGSRWFNPTTVQLVFERAEVEQEEGDEQPLDIQAEPILAETVQEENLDAVIRPEPMRTPKGRINENLARGVLFSEIKPPKPVPQPQPTRVLPPELLRTKNALKSLISEAWNELE